MKKALCIILLLISSPVFAASVTVCDSGCNYTTIANALAGITTGQANTITVQGTYTGNERVTVSKSGASVGNELIIQASGTQTMKGFFVGGSYVIIDGFTITGHTASYSGLLEIAKQVSNIIIRNNILKDSAENVLGFYSYDATYDIANYPSHVTFTGNTVTNIAYNAMMAMQCNYCLVENNTFGPSTTGVDAIRFFGRDSVIRGNEFKNIVAAGGSHTDIFQTFGNNGADCYNLIFERNHIHCDGNICTGLQPCNISGDGREDIRDITFRNNIFNGAEYSCSIGVPNVNWYNNIFINSGRNTAAAIGYRLNWASGTGTGDLRNNVFIGNGTNDGDDDRYGWWYVDAGAEAGVTSSNNYVSKTQASSYGSKSSWNTSNGNLNGGDPKFVSYGTNLNIQSDSPLKDAGTAIASFSNDYAGTGRPQGAAWDIGAYEYSSGGSAGTVNLGAGGTITFGVGGTITLGN